MEKLLERASPLFFPSSSYTISHPPSLSIHSTLYKYVIHLIFIVSISLYLSPLYPFPTYSIIQSLPHTLNINTHSISIVFTHPLTILFLPSSLPPLLTHSLTINNHDSARKNSLRPLCSTVRPEVINGYIYRLA